MLIHARHVLCLLIDDLDDLARIVDAFPGFTVDWTYSKAEPDPRMERAFESSRDRVVPSLGDDDRAAIAGHRAVGYVLSPHLLVDDPDPASAQAVSAQAVRLIGAAFAAGARAAKGESSGIAHGRRRWISLAEMVDGDADSRAMGLHAAWVRRPIGDDSHYYSCGMHLLGKPDVEIGTTTPPATALTWLDAVAIWSLTETGGLVDGELFDHLPGQPGRALIRTACTRYPEDDFFYNPHGYWRIGS
jgi:hypothetical protein